MRNASPQSIPHFKNQPMKKSLTYLFSFLLLILVSSCAHLNKLDLAQRNFSQGATIENNARLLQQPIAISPDAYYKLSYAAVKESLKKRSKLNEDGLLGNAYALQALCEWKLRKYALASSDAKIALTYLTDKDNPNALLTRDAAVMKSMDALINLELLSVAVFDSLKREEAIDLATFEQFFTNQLWGNPTGEKGGLQKSFESINSVLQQVPRKHEVRSYLVMSMLTGMKSWGDALHYLKDNRKKSDAENKDAMKALYQQQKELFENSRTVILRRFARLLPEGEESAVHRYWRYMLGA